MVITDRNHRLLSILLIIADVLIAVVAPKKFSLPSRKVAVEHLR